MNDTSSVHAPFTPDATQRAVINIASGRHLVLAPPGCGKTQILAERIRRAHAEGVDYGDMLCLTFTNRAARGMRTRIQDCINDANTAQVFVGNVHRFCSRYLFENGIVPQESSVIDDNTTISILAAYLQEDEQEVMQNQARRRYYFDIMFFSHLMYELRHKVDRKLRIHPESATAEDVAVLRAICTLRQQPFTLEAMLDIYDHNDYYQELIESEDFDLALQGTARGTLHKMRFAHAYEAYKRQNRLLDFEDLLQRSYVAMRDNPDHRRYPWIQIDEVQDLNLLQLSIVAMLSTIGDNSAPDSTDGTIIYLGDEQQAIFSFMGAKLTTLSWLKKLCGGNIHHLSINHRSPRYLADMLNTFAKHELHSDPALLPQPEGNEQAPDGAMQIVGSNDIDAEFADVAMMAKALSQNAPDETTAIIVNSNQDADRMGDMLDRNGQKHFKVSGADLFASDEVKLLLAHLSVLANERNFLAWSRLLVGLKVCQTHSSARKFVHQMEARAISPTDFFVYPDSTYLQQFVEIYEYHDIIVFDTETTGLNVFEDDVIQIAAERLRQGKRIDKFSVHISTHRSIPTMLGDIPNPIIAERERQVLISPQDALRQFLAFAEGGVLLAHNAEFDYPIMRFNMERYLPEERWQARFPRYFDSLKLIRLLRPDLKAYKLKLLLQELGLEGQNSHLADDDVFATISLVCHCYQEAVPRVEEQRRFLARPGIADFVARLRRNYGTLFAQGRSMLYKRPTADSEPALVAEMRRFEAEAVAAGWVRKHPRMEYIYRFLANDVIVAEQEPTLVEQLSNHTMELNTFKESDLCGSSAIDLPLYVTTIHKAKGLEFDNVIVFDVIDGRIPNYYNENNPQALAEDARKLYVAMSRAKKRLIITHSLTRTTQYGARPLQLSRFMNSVMRYFKHL